ncbi:MAG TPA: hypothetical protein VHN19_16550 [Burkholderiales bacterium]|nr:hypothetical protein [Burkholderiales bacterium]
MVRETQAEEDRIPQDQDWDEEDLGLDWDESEFQRIASQLRTERGATPF